jgi:hypothetical protein
MYKTKQVVVSDSPVEFIYCDLTPYSRNSSLLGNGSVNTFPWNRTRATIEELCFL